MKKTEKMISKDEAAAKESFQKLSLRGKLSHIWHYYKWFFLLFAGAALIIATLTRDIRTNLQEEPFLRVVLLGGNEAAVERTQLFAEFSKQFAEKDTDEVDVDAALKNGDAASLQILSSRIAGKETDLLVLPENLYREYGQRGAFAPLTDLLPEDYLAAHKDAEVSVIDSLSGEEIICGLFADGGKLEEELIYPAGSQNVIAVCAGSDRKENAAMLMRILLP